MQIHTKPLWLNCRWQTTSVDSDHLFLGSSPVKDRQYNHYLFIYFLNRLKSHFLVYNLRFFFFWFCFSLFNSRKKTTTQATKVSRPVLCRDAASILHRHPRSVFGNRLLTAAVNVTTPSTRASAWPGTLIVRVCAEQVQMHVRLYRPKIVLGTTLQASNTTSTNKPTAKP